MKFTAIAMGVVLTCGQACFGDWLFQWEGTVTRITDGEDNDVSWPGAMVGDTVSASVSYDPADFDSGVDVSGDGLDYTRGPGSLSMEYVFSSSSSTTFGKSVAFVTARDGGTFDQWNWAGVSDILLQQNDFTDSSWDLPLPTSFEDMHDLYVDSFAKLIPADTAMFVWRGFGTTEGQIWNLSIRVTDYSLTPDEVPPGTIPAPAAVLLSGLGAGLVGWLRRRRSL